MHLICKYIVSKLFHLSSLMKGVVSLSLSLSLSLSPCVHVGLVNIFSQCGVVAKVSVWESGDPGSSTHSAMETHWVTLGQSQTLSPAYLTGLLL